MFVGLIYKPNKKTRQYFICTLLILVKLSTWDKLSKEDTINKKN